MPIPDPRANAAREQIVLEGDVPSPANPPSACRFHTRCPRATEICSEVEPALVDYGGGHWAACHHPVDREPREPAPRSQPSSNVPDVGVARFRRRLEQRSRRREDDASNESVSLPRRSAAVAIGVGLAACGDDDSGSSGGSSDTIIRGTTDLPVSLDPAGAYDLPSYDIIYNVYQNLVQFPPGRDEAGAGGGRVV